MQKTNKAIDIEILTVIVTRSSLTR